MNEERRLIAIGFPIEDAASICWSMRRDGTLREYVEKQEKEYWERMNGRAEN